MNPALPGDSPVSELFIHYNFLHVLCVPHTSSLDFFKPLWQEALKANFSRVRQVSGK